MSESSLPSMSPCTQTLSPGGPWRPITQGNGSLVCPMPRSPPTCSSTCGAEGEVTHHTEDGSTGKSSNIISCKIKINLGLETNQTTQQNIVNLSMFVSRNKLMEAQSKARSQRGYWQEWNKNSQKQTKNIHHSFTLLICGQVWLKRKLNQCLKVTKIRSAPCVSGILWMWCNEQNGGMRPKCVCVEPALSCSPFVKCEPTGLCPEETNPIQSQTHTHTTFLCTVSMNNPPYEAHKWKYLHLVHSTATQALFAWVPFNCAMYIKD